MKPGKLGKPAHADMENPNESQAVLDVLNTNVEPSQLCMIALLDASPQTKALIETSSGFCTGRASCGQRLASAFYYMRSLGTPSGHAPGKQLKNETQHCRAENSPGEAIHW